MEHQECLNRLLIELGRSLLQYVGECWPWTGAESADERKTLDELVCRQQSNVAQLTGLLAQGATSLDFGAYPTEYTDLHYVGLDYLLQQLAESQRMLVADLEKAVSECRNDSGARELLDEILTAERDILAELQDLKSAQQPVGNN